MRRGYTLIELMIAVALVGIGVVASSGELTEARNQTGQVLHLERARQLLDYEADALSRGVMPDQTLEKELADELPQGAVTIEAPTPSVRWVSVHWKPDGQPLQSIHLSVIVGKP